MIKGSKVRLQGIYTKKKKPIQEIKKVELKPKKKRKKRKKVEKNGK